MAIGGGDFHFDTRPTDLPSGKGLSDPDIREELDAKDFQLETYLSRLRALMGAKFPVVTADIKDRAVTIAKLATETWTGGRWVYADITARDADTVLRGPTFGQICYVYSTDFEYIYNTDFAWEQWTGPCLERASTWTPTYTDFTVGNGTVTTRWSMIAQRVFIDYNFTAGSTVPTFGGAPRLTLPFPFSNVSPSWATNEPSANFNITFSDATGGRSRGFGYPNSTNELGWLVDSIVTHAGIANVVGTVPSGTYPFTWAVNDRIIIAGSYDAYIT